MPKICLRVNDGTYCKKRMMEHIARIEGVESLTENTKERIITVIGDTDPVSLCRVLRENGFSPELLSVGPSREDKKLGWTRDTENRGSNHYLGVQRTEAVGGSGGMNRAIEDKEGSEKRIVEVVAGFGDFTSIEVDIKKGMVTVVGKSVPVSVAKKVREMGYRAKLLSLGPTTEEEDTDEQHNDDLYPDSIVYDSNLYEDPILEDVCTITCFYFVHSVVSVFIIFFFLFYAEDVEDFCIMACFYLGAFLFGVLCRGCRGFGVL